MNVLDGTWKRSASSVTVPTILEEKSKKNKQTNKQTNKKLETTCWHGKAEHKREDYKSRSEKGEEATKK